jgi:hypothetical protein
MTSENPISEKTLQRLREVRHSLLRLHKVLLEHQRQVYERTNGQVRNSYQLLKLVMHDPVFAWLHHLSELVVQIDEMLDADDQPRENDAVGLLDQASLLITPAESGGDFQQRYLESLQQSPDVVLAHSEVVKQLGKKPPEIH